MSRSSTRLLGLLALAVAMSGYGAAGVSASPTVWGCYPGQQPNPCDGSLATTTLASTTLQPRKVAGIATPTKDVDPPIDCFYVYPTVVSLPQQNAPKYLTAEVKAIYEWQAAYFSQHCRVFAPIYRQATLAGIASPVASGSKPGTDRPAEPSPAFKLAYGDVLSAWNDYLQQDNHGRGVVLIGHSQGSGMLVRLLREQIDPDPAQRALLVSAIVPGANLLVARGQRTGGDLQNVPTCASAAELGCVIAYSAYASRPSGTSLFGRVDSSLRAATGLPTPADSQVACVNPASLSGSDGRLATISRTTGFPGPIGLAISLLYYGLAPRASTPWVIPGERYRAACVDYGRANVLRVRPANSQTVQLYEAPWADWGLHLGDLNLPLGNLLSIVQRQSAAWAATQHS